MRVSIVIATYQRHDSLRRTVRSVLRQSFNPKDYEIIIVDDGSVPPAADVIAELQTRHPRHFISYHYQKNTGSAAAKNIGAQLARGQFILFTDDDCVVPKNWIALHLEAYHRFPHAVGAGGWYETPPYETRFLQRVGNAIRISALASRGYLNGFHRIHDLGLPLAYGSNVSYRREVFLKIGGFDRYASALASDDLKARILMNGNEIVSVPVRVIHYCPYNFFSAVKRFVRQGATQAYLNKKYFRGAQIPYGSDVSFCGAWHKFLHIAGRIATKTQYTRIEIIEILVFFALRIVCNALGALCSRLDFSYSVDNHRDYTRHNSIVLLL